MRTAVASAALGAQRRRSSFGGFGGKNERRKVRPPAYSRAPKNSTPPFRLFVGGRAAYPLPVCTSSRLSTSSGVCSSMALPPSA